MVRREGGFYWGSGRQYAFSARRIESARADGVWLLQVANLAGSIRGIVRRMRSAIRALVSLQHATACPGDDGQDAAYIAHEAKGAIEKSELPNSCPGIARSDPFLTSGV